MEPIRWKVGRVIDAHVHYRHREPAEYFNKILGLVGYSRANILTGWELRGLDRKREQPDRFYTFGMIPHDPAKLAAGDGAYRVPCQEPAVACGRRACSPSHVCDVRDPPPIRSLPDP